MEPTSAVVAGYSVLLACAVAIWHAWVYCGALINWSKLPGVASFKLLCQRSTVLVQLVVAVGLSVVIVGASEVVCYYNVDGNGSDALGSLNAGCACMVETLLLP